MSKKTTNIEMSEYFDIPNPKLRAYLGIVEKGNAEEYRTPFYKGTTLETVLGNWIEHLAKLDREWPSLYQFEIDLGKKVGPMSIMKPLEERMDDIWSYYSDVERVGEPLLNESISRTLKEWSRISGLRMRSQKSTLDNMKKSTNSGSPYFTKRKSVVSKTLPSEICRTNGEYFIKSPGYLSKPIAVLGWRGQEGGPEIDDVKQRVVWMFPFAVNLCELQVYQPLIAGAQRANLVPAWVSMESVDSHITAMFNTKGSDDYIVCTDFTKFDQHFGAPLQSASLELLTSLFKGDPQFKNWSENVFPLKYEIPLLVSWGEACFGKHGMGSGSGGTNADETLTHRALQHEAAINSNTILNPYSQCLGDDGVLTFPGIKVDNVIDSYSPHGLEMNEDKQYVSKHDCIYLRRWHHEDYKINGIAVGVYATTRALGRLCEQERFYDPDVWSREMVALRQLSIIENVKYHPLKEEFVEYCMKGDKYRLGLDIPGFLDNIESVAQKAIDYMPDFLGYTKSLQNEGKQGRATGIENWWIVQYLKSKA